MPRFASSPARDTATAVCLAVALVGVPVLAQTPAQDAYEEAGWTGKLQDPATARKEAGAALVEGRRECARQPGDKAACLKKVQADHAATLKRIQSANTKR